MTTARQIRKLVRPLLERHPDLVLLDHAIWLLPLGQVARKISIERSSMARYFTLKWRLMELFGPKSIPGYTLGLCFSQVPRSRQFWDEIGGGTWVWSDPTMAEDFVVRVEEVMLPLLRSLDTTEKALTFMKAHDESSDFRGWPWNMAAAVALGDLETARRIWLDTARHQLGPDAPPPGSRNPWDRYRELGAPLLADDRDALARILHRWEAENVRGTALEPYWQPTPFPLERAT
ncbi:hypothetical protein [Methylobacterium nigriterrae]|uniref:hypothetical protein n=1 Tax=Methylobacterium nigriterrae TaxID=3127512 RepID=UPI003013D3AC